MISIWRKWLDEKRDDREKELQAQYGMPHNEAVAWTAIEYGEPIEETAARL